MLTVQKYIFFARNPYSFTCNDLLVVLEFHSKYRDICSHYFWCFLNNPFLKKKKSWIRTTKFQLLVTSYRYIPTYVILMYSVQNGVQSDYEVEIQFPITLQFQTIDIRYRLLYLRSIAQFLHKFRSIVLSVHKLNKIWKFW